MNALVRALVTHHRLCGPVEFPSDCVQGETCLRVCQRIPETGVVSPISRPFGALGHALWDVAIVSVAT